MTMKRTLLIAGFIFLAAAFVGPAPSFSEPRCMWREQRPYGGYCMGPRWGWYGARQPVKTVEDARKHLEKFFEGKDVSVGQITDRGFFFSAEIKDRANIVVDSVIVNKRTGRIRSTF
jgi:hypothetical protein